MIASYDLLAMWTPGPLELAIILLIALLIFGKRLPNIARNMGSSLNEFKKGIRDVKKTKDEIGDEVKKTIDPNSEDSVSDENSCL